MESECWAAYETLHYFNQIKKASVIKHVPSSIFQTPV